MSYNTKHRFHAAETAECEENMKKLKLTDLLAGILFTLFFISIGVIAAVNFRFVYYFDIGYLNIPEQSGFDKAVIRENYDALIDYNSPFFKGDLKFPTLPSSPEALQHFAEVKTIFVSFYYLAPVTLLFLLILIFYKRRKQDYRYLFVSAVTVLVLPAIISAGCAVNFDEVFFLFHKLFFRNNYWLFDPSTDPVILILPDTFFFHALLVIIAFILVGSLALFLLFFSKRRTERRKPSV